MMLWCRFNRIPVVSEWLIVVSDIGERRCYGGTKYWKEVPFDIPVDEEIGWSFLLRARDVPLWLLRF